jgi:hypothetical protein
MLLICSLQVPGKTPKENLVLLQTVNRTLSQGGAMESLFLCHWYEAENVIYFDLKQPFVCANSGELIFAAVCCRYTL